MTKNQTASLIINTGDAEKKLNDLLLEPKPVALERPPDLVSHSGDVFIDHLFDVVNVVLSQDATAVDASAHGVVCNFNIVVHTKILATALGKSNVNL